MWTERRVSKRCFRSTSGNEVTRTAATLSDRRGICRPRLRLVLLDDVPCDAAAVARVDSLALRPIPDRLVLRPVGTGRLVATDSACTPCPLHPTTAKLGARLHVLSQRRKLLLGDVRLVKPWRTRRCRQTIDQQSYDGTSGSITRWVVWLSQPMYQKAKNLRWAGLVGGGVGVWISRKAFVVPRARRSRERSRQARRGGAV